MSLTILVVDDSEVDRLLIGGLLRQQKQYQVEFAPDGYAALEQVALTQPDLVITDLIMPGLDGLELIREIRSRWPEIAIILMTAYGNETTAVEALEAGAASYVPKAQQAERLSETVERVARRLRAERAARQLAARLNELYCSYTLENNPILISALVDQLQQTLGLVGLGDGAERVRICVALEEALLNAMYHGNLEIDEEDLAKARASLRQETLTRLVEQRRGLPQMQNRSVTLDAHISRESARFVIRDQGRGFDVHAATGHRLRDYFECGRGRGLMLMRSVMDEVQFNDTGNQVTLVKHDSPLLHAALS